MKTKLKILTINLVLLLAVFLILELIFGHWVSHGLSLLSTKDPKERFTQRYYETVFVMCPDKYLHHVYCPEISHQKKLSESDGGEIITSYTNKSSVRVANIDDMVTTTDTSAYDIINIGDSLLQAKEVFYEDTLGQVLEFSTGKNVLQIGMGGWGPVNFHAWLRHNPLQEGVNVNIFVTPNDILPNDKLSNLNYHNLGTLDKNNELIFDNFSPVWTIFDKINFVARFKHTLEMNSILYRTFVRVRTRLKEKPPQQSVSSPHIFSDTLTEPVTNCNRIKSYNDISVQTRDYVRLAFAINCWDEELRENVDSGVEDLRKAAHIVLNRKGSVRIFIVPALLAFEDQGEKVKAHPKFNMAPNSAITSEPLSQYIAAKLADMPIEVISLEKVIRKMKQADNEKLFFLEDSHWTRKMNKLLGTWMAKTFYQ